MKSVGILYICTGRYSLFFENFLTSCECYFLPGYRKEYFIFTDKEIRCDNSRCHFIHQEKLGWPFDTLMRFHMFYEQYDELKMLDYLFFFNANALLLQPVYDDILPDSEGLVGVIHPGFYCAKRADFTYESNPESLACIAPDEGEHYYMGGLNGGTSGCFLQMSYRLAKNIEIDLEKKIIAVWHDESHLNRYFIDHPPKALTCEYAFPEGWMLPFDKKIMLLDKSKFGGHAYLRQVD